MCTIRSIVAKGRRIKPYVLIKYGNLFPYRRYMIRNKCLFIHIPKAAGTSVLQSLAGHRRFIARDHVSATEFIRADFLTFNKLYKFTFSRHPVDRLFSVYRYIIAGGNRNSDKLLSTKISQECPSFDHFVCDFLDHQRLHMHLLFKPQVSFICDERYNILVDYVGRFESIEKDFEVLEKRFNFPLPLVHTNKSPSYDRNRKFSLETIQRIEELYKKDFEVLKYEVNR